MSRRSSLSALAVLAASGALIAGCTSSIPSSSSTPTATATSAPVSSPTPVASTPATSTAATSTATRSASEPSVADCATINKISAGVVAVLEPLQTESTAKAGTALKGYVALLTTQAATMNSPAGKAAFASFIAAFKKAETEPKAQASTTVTTAIGNLGSACS
jgi:hypothetical protein